MPIKLYTDSCCDLSAEMASQLNVSAIPLIYTLDGQEYYDDFGQSMSSKEFYNTVRSGSMPSTALISTQRYLDAFTPELEAGNDILYLAFSSALSGSYQCSVIAIEELKAKYPDRMIQAIDTKCASLGEGLLIYYVATKMAEGASFDELAAYAAELAPQVCHWFTVDDLNHLKRGGRVSGATAAIGTMLSIKPVLHVDDEGRLISMGKERGRKKALKALVTHMEETVSDKEQVVFISHGDSVDDATAVADMVRAKFPQVTDVQMNTIGPVIGSHAGPGTIALFFLGTSRG